ncbi:2Fe-2S iron-sulfur cluster-binding protein [Parafrankia sp. BMG5.11]|uniref:2Fe-2S iron-sulfur cluster-binding protein n=1 Tax=Parafrankia sp. BMG5.11 TaxID=222540 RepID=UPI00103CA52A|nr:2Fe-2S iron-sulfur cluster-binding protein [Parafrankia sp. BMG5.11]TCJ37001.1 2Fe-2S iron-sulfur cluster binding domain-containing protein [Parafrankia sp. BMG5.11]
MAAVTYVQPDGTARTCVNFEGMTVMHLAVGNFVDGIDALCGGVRQCGTCHVYLDPAWTDRVGPPSADERDMLEALDGVEVRATSRLACQIHLSEQLDGLVVEIPQSQPGV